MPPKEYFYKAVFRICSHLHIEKSLEELHNLLKEHIPLDFTAAQFLNEELKSLHTIAYVTKNGGKLYDDWLPLTPEAIDFLYNLPPEDDVFLIEEPKESLVSREIGQHYQEFPSSIIVLVLRNVYDSIGFISLMTKGKEKFKAEHLRWVELVKAPLLIAMANAKKHFELYKYNQQLVKDNEYFKERFCKDIGTEVIGSFAGLKSVIEKVKLVAEKDTPVLILGETGVGKEVIANLIHELSDRKKNNFVCVNCGAIPETLIDSELFGHEQGAFTGATYRKKGKFERANKGTIFLDEIGELPIALQTRLLRVIQTKEIERVGGEHPISLNTRIIAATNKNLELCVKEKSFREDLLFRLNVFPIIIPPLRERMSDLPSLVNHFLKKKSNELRLKKIPSLGKNAIDVLQNYNWPGNVRELENVVERALIINPHGPIDFDFMSYRKREALQDEFQRLDDVMKMHIENVIEKTKGKIHGPGGAAEILDINSSTLRNRMDKLGINYLKRN